MQMVMPRVRRSEVSLCKKSSSDRPEKDSDTPPPQQRNAANARERARMRVLSRAFCRLKTTLPWVPADTKLSKLDTLRLATSYIAHLRDSLLAPGAAAAAAVSAAAVSATAVASAAGESNSPQSPLQHTNGIIWPLSFQPKLPEPWLSRRTNGNAPPAFTHQSGASHRPPCSIQPLSLSSLPSVMPPTHGAPPSPPSSSGEIEEDEDPDEPWQLMHLYHQSCE